MCTTLEEDLNSIRAVRLRRGLTRALLMSYAHCATSAHGVGEFDMRPVSDPDLIETPWSAVDRRLPGRNKGWPRGSGKPSE